MGIIHLSTYLPIYLSMCLSWNMWHHGAAAKVKIKDMRVTEPQSFLLDSGDHLAFVVVSRRIHRSTVPPSGHLKLLSLAAGIWFSGSSALSKLGILRETPDLVDMISTSRVLGFCMFQSQTGTLASFKNSVVVVKTSQNISKHLKTSQKPPNQGLWNSLNESTPTKPPAVRPSGTPRRSDSSGRSSRPSDIMK